MPPASLYIHLPFCSRKCLFCSFTIAVGQEHRREEYVRALVQEMGPHQGQRLKTLYCGGGTPSLLEENHFEILMEAVRKNFVIDADAEISIEANPESIDAAKAAIFKKFGFNRVSLGVQSMDARYLKFLGRGHGPARAREAVAIVREAGLSNINVDLMYAFPGQTRQDLQQDVRAITALDPKHISLYALTIEPDSRFGAVQMKLDDEETLAGHFQLIETMLSESGFAQYEISNFSRPGFESRHNRNYWQGGAYIGLGVGAHGFDGRRRYWNTPRLKEYLERMDKGSDAREGHEDLNEDQRRMEQVLFGLRMNEGVPWDLLPQDRQSKVKDWIRDGFFVLKDGRLQATGRGRLVLDELSSRLI